MWELPPSSYESLFAGSDYLDDDLRPYMLGMLRSWPGSGTRACAGRRRRHDGQHEGGAAVSAFTVSGAIDGARYEVLVDTSYPEPVLGSGLVRALVAQHLGRDVLLTPTGPVVKVDRSDARSLLALLSTKTAVSAIGPGAPTLAGPRRPGAVS